MRGEWDETLTNWRIRQLWNEQDMSSKRRSRYMADVRHPLKPRRLDEKRQDGGLVRDGGAASRSLLRARPPTSGRLRRQSTKLVLDF